MSRKTKKKKIIADYRRKMRLLEAQKRRSQEMYTVDAVEISSKEKKQIRKPRKVSEDKTNLNSFDKDKLAKQARLIRLDLRKTVILSIIGIGILFGLYFFAPF